MPGVSGVGSTPFFAAQLCGVSAKLNHSNSSPHIGCTPSFSARLRTPFSNCRGQIGNGEPSALTKSPRKNGTLLSHGTLRPVAMSSCTIASGKPCCHPITCVLSYTLSFMSQPNTTLQNPNPPSAADRNLSLCRYLPRKTPSMSVTATLTLPDGEFAPPSTGRSACDRPRSASWSCLPSSVPPWAASLNQHAPNVQALLQLHVFCLERLQCRFTHTSALSAGTTWS